MSMSRPYKVYAVAINEEPYEILGMFPDIESAENYIIKHLLKNLVIIERWIQIKEEFYKEDFH